jgi:hypothetical protein
MHMGLLLTEKPYHGRRAKEQAAQLVAASSTDQAKKKKAGL